MEGLAELGQTGGFSMDEARGNPDVPASLIEHVENVRSRFASIDPPPGVETGATPDYARNDLERSAAKASANLPLMAAAASWFEGRAR